MPSKITAARPILAISILPNTPPGPSDRQIANAAGTGDSRPNIAQLLLKPAGLMGLVEFRVEQYKAAVTQGENADDQESVPAPSQESIGARRMRHLPCNSDFHGRLF